jgi:hypothetical protein
MLGIGRGESYVIKQSGLWIQRDHTLDLESVLLADGVKGRVLIHLEAWEGFGEDTEKELFRQVCVEYRRTPREKICHLTASIGQND